MLSTLLYLTTALGAQSQEPSKLPGLVTDPWLQLTSSSTGMVVEFITHQNPKITIDAGGLYVKKIENMALKTDDLELQKFVIGNIKPNTTFQYSLVEGDQKVTYTGHAPKVAGTVSRLAIFGDSGSGLPEQKELAVKVRDYDPDLIVHVGDIVYPHGQEPDYLTKHFAVYGDVLSRTPMAAAAGNHDTTYRDYEKYPGGLAYYKFFNLPKNEYPWAKYIGNYSFTYGNAFWLILDSNTYTDWNDPRAQAWVKQELAKGATSTWRFVAFHHAPWHASKAHQEDIQMRVLDGIFKQSKVQVVFSGHVHNYQRSRPDAAGPYYIVSGAGGADLYDQDIAKDKTQWKPYTQVYAAGFSYTQLQYDAKSMSLKQVGLDGSTLDNLTLTAAPVKATKPAPKPASKKKKGG